MDFRIDEEKGIGYITFNYGDTSWNEIWNKFYAVSYKLNTIVIETNNAYYNVFTEMIDDLITYIRDKKSNIKIIIRGNPSLQVSIFKYIDNILEWRGYLPPIDFEIPGFDKKDIVLEDAQKTISKYAFYGNKVMESIIIPKTVTSIGEKAFKKCSSLKNITLPDSIEEIDLESFENCTNLEKISIPKSVKIIDNSVFEGCKSLKEINLYDGLEEINQYAFGKCKNLKEIIIPSSVRKLGAKIFYKCDNLKYVTIRYKNYQELFNLIRNNEDFFGKEREKSSLLYRYHSAGICPLKLKSYVEGYKNKKVYLVFEGPELDREQKQIIENLVIDKKAKIVFKVNKKVLLIEDKKVEVEEKQHNNKYDEEIENLLNKINKLCSYLSEETRNNILGIVKNLLDKYEKDVDNLKPKLDDYYNSGLQLTFSKEPKSIKLDLLANLEIIIMNLSSTDNLIKFLEEINSYKKLLSTNIDTESLGDTLEDNIKNIIYYSKYLYDNDYLDKLSRYIEDTINNISTSITKMYNDDNVILSNNIDYKQEFNLNISKLYDEVHSEFNRVGRFIMLLNSLVIKDDEFTNESDITDMINSTKYVISGLSNSNYNKKLEEEFDKLRKKYIDIINTIIYSDNEGESTSYEEVERNLRNDLTPLLEEINKYAYLDKYEKDKANTTNILNQLNISKDIVNSGKIVELSEEYKLQAITSYVIELNNRILSNKLLDDESKIGLSKNIIKKLDEALLLVNENKIKSLDEYNETLKTIISSLIDIEFVIDKFTQDLEEYNKYYK